jgi:hypothetical protein
MEIVIGFYVAWKFEIIGSAVLALLLFLRHRYDDNVLVTSFLKQGLDVLAAKMEAERIEPQTARTKQQRRTKIRRDLAKAARKANRSNK